MTCAPSKGKRGPRSVISRNPVAQAHRKFHRVAPIGGIAERQSLQIGGSVRVAPDEG